MAVGARPVGRTGMQNNSLVPQGTGYLRGGSEMASFVREINQEWMLGGDKEFGKFRGMHLSEVTR